MFLIFKNGLSDYKSSIESISLYKMLYKSSDSSDITPYPFTVSLPEGLTHISILCFST